MFLFFIFRSHGCKESKQGLGLLSALQPKVAAEAGQSGQQAPKVFQAPGHLLLSCWNSQLVLFCWERLVIGQVGFSSL